MKQNKSKAFKIMLASTLGAVAFGCVVGGVASLVDIEAKAAATVSLVSLFDNENMATVSAVEKKTVFTLPKRTKENLDKPAKVIFDRDIALAWHSSKTEEGFFNTTFKLKDTNFSKLTVKMEATPARTMKEKKSVNEIIFKTVLDGDVVTGLEVSVKADGGDAVVAKTVTDYVTDTEMTIRFAKEAGGYTDVQEDEFVVLLSCGSLVDEPIGKFVNIGENLAEEYSDDDLEIDPLTFTAEFDAEAADDSKTEIEFVSLNGQSFDLDDDNKVADTAKPVLVVNENVDSIALGTKFTLDYQVIDVVDTSPTTVKEYYQYTPLDDKKEELPYATLSSSTIFFDTKDVYGVEGKEYISIRFKLSDDKFTGEEATFVELAWYTDQSRTPALPAGKDADDVRYTTSYIVADRNTEGPEYLFNNDSAKIEAYQALVTTEAEKEDFTAGSNCYFLLPSLKGYVEDNDTSYQNLDFIVSYKSKNSDSATATSTLSANGLKFSVATAGRYEFKVLVKDKAGNAPKYMLDGKMTEVTSSNIWEFDEIPSFWFTVKNKGLSIDNATSTSTDTDGFIDTKYSFNDFTVNGLLGESEYELYYIDVAAFQAKYPNAGFSANSLSEVLYDKIKEKAAEADRIGDDYMKDYLSIYVEVLAENLNLEDELTLSTLLEGDDPIMRKIEEDQGISKSDNPDDWKASDDAYEWNASEQTFKPQKAGAYLMLGVFTDSELVGERVAAYKAVSVSAKRDAIKGDAEWLKNNVASVVLFSIAGVMLVAIIILLVVKPSDETLEEVGADGKDVKKSKKKEEDEQAE